MEKYSKQREEVFNFIKNAKNHPTAEEIYMLLKENNPNISRGTVYRNLNLLVDKGMVKKISISNMPDRFDYICQSHSHTVCKLCGNVSDFTFPIEEESLEKAIREQTDLEIFSNEFTIYGICKKCQEANKKY